jgi:hypothetical protein
MGGVAFVAGILAGHIDADGAVDVAALRDDPSLLDTALTTIAVVGPRTNPEAFPSRQHQLAYYLDAYGTLVLEAIVDRTDETAVPHLRADPFPFRRSRVDGRDLDLVRLRETIAATFTDPRVHVALACGAASCPAFRGFAPESVDAELDAAARAFVDDETHVQVEDGVVRLSPIFRWYRRDFEAAGGALAFVARYRTEPLPADARLEWLAWDRTLSVRAQ